MAKQEADILQALKTLKTEFKLEGPNKLKEEITQITSLLQELFGNVIDAIGIVSSCQNLSMIEQAKTLVFCKHLTSAFDVISKELSKLKDSLTLQVVKRMTAEELLKISTTEYTFSSAVRLFTSLPTYGTSEFLELKDWLLDNGWKDMIHESISSKGIQSMTNTMLEDGKEPPPNVKTFIKPSIRITQRKGSKNG